MVATEDALDLTVARDHRGERVRVAQIDGVHVANAAGKGRVMQRDDGRLLRPRGQRRIEEPQPIFAQQTVAGTGHNAIQHDQPNRVILDRVLDEMRVGRDARQMSKFLAERLATVMIAGDRIDRHFHMRPSISRPCRIRRCARIR